MKRKYTVVNNPAVGSVHRLTASGSASSLQVTLEPTEAIWETTDPAVVTITPTGNHLVADAKVVGVGVADVTCRYPGSYPNEYITEGFTFNVGGVEQQIDTLNVSRQQLA